MLDMDTDMESWKEMLYEKWAKLSPEKTWMELLSVYRLKDEFSGKEYLLYKIKKHIPDNNGQDVSAEIWVGKKPRLDTRNILDNDGNIINKVISKWNMVYTQDWDIKIFEKVTKESRNKRFAMYIALTSDEYHTNWTGTPIMIKNDKIYKESSYDELISYDDELKRTKPAPVKQLGQ